MLEAVGAVRKRVTHQIFQLHFTKAATGLFVRQDVLKVGHLPGQCRDMLVRLVDHRQLFGHAGQ